MVKLSVLSAKERKERDERYRQEQIKEAQDRAKQLFEQDRARREAVERQRAEERRQADIRAKQQADYYRKLKKQQDDFKKLQEFRKKQKAIAEQRKKYLAEQEAKRQRLLKHEYMTDGLTPQELRKIKNMSPEELREAIKALREELYTTTQKPISSMVLRSRYEDLKANEERDGDPMRRNRESVVGKTFEEWREDNYPTLTELRERYDETDKTIPFDEYVKQQGDYYVLNKQSVEVSPSGETTSTTGNKLPLLPSLVGQTAIATTEEQTTHPEDEDKENEAEGKETHRDHKPKNLENDIPPYQEDKRDKRFYELFEHTKISRNKILELCKDAEDSYDDKLIEGDLQYYVRDDFTDTQALFKLKGDYFTLAFRGTQESYDFLTDIRSKQANLQVAKLSDFWDWIDDDDDLYGHYGFITAVRSIYNDLVSKISIYQGKTFDIGSHSLGGALTTIFSYVYTIDPTIDEKVPLRYVITFGSPRVFYNHKTHEVSRYDKRVEQLRIFNHNDIVSFVPAQDSEVISSSVLSTMVGGYGAMIGGRNIGIAGGILGGMMGQFLGGFKHIGLGIMLMGELTHTPYEISTQHILKSGEQTEHHYKIIPKGQDTHRNPFDLVSGSIFQNFVGNMVGYLLPDTIKNFMGVEPQVEKVMNEKDHLETMSSLFQDLITGDRGLFYEYKNAIVSDIVSTEDYEVGSPRLDFLPPSSPSTSLSSKAIAFFYKTQIPRFQEFFFQELLNEVYKEGRLDQYKALTRGSLSPRLYMNPDREGVITSTIMEKPEFSKLTLLMDRDPNVARIAMDYNKIKEIIVSLHGTKYLDFLNTIGRRFYNRLIEETMNRVDFRDWRNMQYLTYGSNIMSLLSNSAHIYYIHQKVIGHKFPSYIDNIQQLPPEILRIENNKHLLEDVEGNTYRHLEDGVYTGETNKNKEGENIKQYLQSQGIQVEIPKHIENFKIHLENDEISLRHNNHKILGFYFYENENEIKNKFCVWR